MTQSYLDNPVWHALTGLQADLAEIHGLARRYDRGVSVFSAVEELSPRAWKDLEACAEDGTVALIAPELPDAPAGWTEQWRAPIDQMVLERLHQPKLDDAPALRDLAPDDIDAVMELIALASPGPFVRGTPRLGRYIGVFDGDQLVAMAGERMRLPGMTEVSAVCTRPEARGRGFGEHVSHVIASGIVARGDQPFLHVAADNDTAKRIYERLGFRRAQTVLIALYETT